MEHKDDDDPATFVTVSSFKLGKDGKPLVYEAADVIEHLHETVEEDPTERQAEELKRMCNEAKEDTKAYQAWLSGRPPTATMTKEDVAQVHKTSAQERMTLEDLDKEVAREWASVHPPTATITKERLAHVNRIDAHGQRILEDIEKHDLKAAEDRKRLLRMEELYRKYLSDLDAGIAGLEQDPTRPPPTLLLPKDCYDFVIGFHREEEAEMDEMRLRLLECMTPDKSCTCTCRTASCSDSSVAADACTA